MKIVGYLKTSLIEWPGKISSVIFVPGCNFRCPFCHNRDLVEPERIKKLLEYREESVLEDLHQRKKWIDGVVVTGGEPTLQPDLPDFLSRLKGIGFSVMIETNGSRSEAIRHLLRNQLFDYLAIDIKKELPREVSKSLEIVFRSRIPFELRTTVVPGIHDEKILIKMAQRLSAVCRQPPVKSLIWVLQDFQPKNCLDPAFEKIKPYSKIEMKKFLRAVKKIIPGAKVRD